MRSKDLKKNKKLTDFECLKEFIVANSLKKMKVLRRFSSPGENRLLQEFDRLQK